MPDRGRCYSTTRRCDSCWATHRSPRLVRVKTVPGGRRPLAASAGSSSHRTRLAHISGPNHPRIQRRHSAAFAFRQVGQKGKLLVGPFHRLKSSPLPCGTKRLMFRACPQFERLRALSPNCHSPRRSGKIENFAGSGAASSSIPRRSASCVARQTWWGKPS